MKLKYKCLVLDHDDTVVNSTATVHYPCFVEYAKNHIPHIQMTLEEYFQYNFDPGVFRMYAEICGMSQEEIHEEHLFWKEYVKQHIPQVYPGMKAVLEAHKLAGGLITVVIHSLSENILRDYREWRLPEPDLIFGSEQTPEHRKPNPWPLEQIMNTFDLRPEEMLMIDDLKPGYDMAKAMGVSFAAARWANDIIEIEQFMRSNCVKYFKNIKDLETFLFG